MPLQDRRPAVPGLLAPMRHRAFRRLVVARAATSFDKVLAPVALGFAVLDLTGSTVDLGLAVAARSAALVAFLLVGGVAADRLPRVLVLQGSSLAAAASQALLAAALFAHRGSLPLLLALAAASGAFAGTSLPASAALTPQTVPDHLLQQANAAVRLVANTATLVGASAAGVLVAAVSPAFGLAVDAALFVLVAACFVGLRDLPRPPVAARLRPLAELREGWRDVVGRRWLWVVVAAFSVVNAVGAGGLQVVGPAVADRTVGRAVWGFALAAQTVGALVGAALAGRWRPSRALATGVALSTLEALPLLAVAGWARPVPLVTAMLLAGVAAELFNIAWDVSVQEQVPAERLARVYSFDALGSYVAIPLGQVAAGPLTARFGSGPTLVAGAGLLLAATGAALASRDVRSLRRRGPVVPEPPPQAGDPAPAAT